LLERCADELEAILITVSLPGAESALEVALKGKPFKVVEAEAKKRVIGTPPGCENRIVGHARWVPPQVDCLAPATGCECEIANDVHCRLEPVICTFFKVMARLTYS